nr:hypothetical protein [Tanacetum cinerariifolium]
RAPGRASTVRRHHPAPRRGMATDHARRLRTAAEPLPYLRNPAPQRDALHLPLPMPGQRLPFHSPTTQARAQRPALSVQTLSRTAGVQRRNAGGVTASPRFSEGLLAGMRLPAKAVCLCLGFGLGHRVRQQAGSYRFCGWLGNFG